MDAPTRDLLLAVSHFRVLIDGREAGFSWIGRLHSVTDQEPPTEPQLQRRDTVVLRRALTRSHDLWQWRQRNADGVEDRRLVTVQQLDRAGGEVVNAWQLEGAWPCRWSGPVFDAAANEVALEEIELTFEKLVWLPNDLHPHPSEGARDGRAP